ncbi:hypothetical protein NPIL_629761 [Nephila pilipes]|uniref:Uncharacterized protein n=1 Tax=Nephila pilipes TaxID=299642 RepID=A0A8X6UJ09_NEPPI|nr:hypothetical protein NPIL_629761 [Nephila pilipes]
MNIQKIALHYSAPLVCFGEFDVSIHLQFKHSSLNGDAHDDVHDGGHGDDHGGDRGDGGVHGGARGDDGVRGGDHDDGHDDGDVELLHHREALHKSKCIRQPGKQQRKPED